MLDTDSRWGDWESVKRMSLDEVDLANLLLDARDDARARAAKQRERDR